MKASILLLTILGTIAINVVTGGPIEDPTQMASSENGNGNAKASDVDVLSRQKRSSCCWKVQVSYAEKHHVQKEQGKLFQYYTQEPGLVNGHVHYTSEDGTRAIWFGKFDKWVIGEASYRGGTQINAHSGTCGSECKPRCPDDVLFTWEYIVIDSGFTFWKEADKGLSIYCTS